MSNGIGLARLAGVFGVCSISLLAADTAPERSCWLRDAAAPANSVVHILCEQGGIWSTADAGATWSKRETGSAERPCLV